VNQRLETLLRIRTDLDALIADELKSAEGERPPADPLAMMVAELRSECWQGAILVLDDRWVKEADAARLIGRAATTVRNWRQGSAPLTWKRIQGATYYELAELARYKIGAVGALVGAPGESIG
jgi:hypothetical protein